MGAKADMLKLLDRLEKAEKMVAYLQATPQ
jgi:hypothetical protein